MTNLNKLIDVINYDTDSDDLIRIQFKDGVIKTLTNDFGEKNVY